MSEMLNTEVREDTACIQITRSVKGCQKCNFTVDVGEEFFTLKKIGSIREEHSRLPFTLTLTLTFLQYDVQILFIQ